MKKNRSEVEKILKIVLTEVNAKRNLKNEIIKEFGKRGFLPGEANAILSGTNPLYQLTEDILYLLIVVLYDKVEDVDLVGKIKPELLLTDVEINKANNIIRDVKEETVYPLTLQNINKDAEDDYSTIFYLDRISDLFDWRILKYNYETQRPLVNKVYSGNEVKEIYLNKNSKKEITKNILDGTQLPDEITLNILQNGEEEFDFSSGNLTIFKGELDVIDGWHRIVAGREAYRINPNVNFYFKVRIVHWDVDKAKAFIRQKSKGNKLDIMATKSYDVYNLANQVVTKLNENPKCILRGKISQDKSDIQKGKPILSFDVAFDTIKILFNIENNEEVFLLSNYLKDGFNLIAENNINLFKEKQDNKFWVSIFVILKTYYNTENWQVFVLDAVEKLNIDQLNKMNLSKINKTSIAKIETILKESVINV